MEFFAFHEFLLHFIYSNRKGLNIDFVLAQVHQLIDLVFGKLQRGQGAVATMNTYLPAFSEDFWTLKSRMPEDRISEVETMEMLIGQVLP
jgi:hypothetical protein